jgi:hypothetical protein
VARVASEMMQRISTRLEREHDDTAAATRDAAGSLHQRARPGLRRYDVMIEEYDAGFTDPMTDSPSSMNRASRSHRRPSASNEAETDYVYWEDSATACAAGGAIAVAARRLYMGKKSPMQRFRLRGAVQLVPMVTRRSTMGARRRSRPPCSSRPRCGDLGQGDEPVPVVSSGWTTCSTSRMTSCASRASSRPMPIVAPRHRVSCPAHYAMVQGLYRANSTASTRGFRRRMPSG